MKIRQYRLFDMKAQEVNPRKMSQEDKDALQNSIKTFGLLEPLIVNMRTGRLISGHQRRDELFHLGIEATDVIELDMDEDNEQALAIALNSISGEWDYAKLPMVIGLIESEELLRATGFSAQEFADIEGKQYIPIAPIEPELTGAKKTERCPNCGQSFVP